MPFTLKQQLAAAIQPIALADTPASHSQICINTLTASITLSYRCGFDGCNSLYSFAMTRQSFVGAILAEADGQYFPEPELVSFVSFPDFQFFSSPDPSPPERPWESLLAHLSDIEILEPGPEPGSFTAHTPRNWETEKLRELTRWDDFLSPLDAPDAPVV